MKGLVIFSLLAALCSGLASAETREAFVKEEGVRVMKEASPSGDSVTVVGAGEAVELLETWHKVRLQSGRVGWIKGEELLIPPHGVQRVALLFKPEDEPLPSRERAISNGISSAFKGEVELISKGDFQEILDAEGLSLEAAVRYPEDFVGLLHELAGIIVCRYTTGEGKIRLDARYVDMRVKDLTRGTSVLGELGSLEEVASELAERLRADLQGLLFPAPAVKAEADEGEGSRIEGLLKRMVLIPEGEALLSAGEGPVKRVRVKAFLMDRFEVTNAEFKEFDPSYTYPAGEDDHPASGISWEMAARYARWVGKRLPTEAEWVRAASSGDGRLYPWGNAFDPSRANINSVRTTPVGSFEEGRSPYGAYDMIGNVWEWTATPSRGGISMVLRGGAWSSPLPGEGEVFRYTAFPKDRSAGYGFRCAISLGDLPQELRDELKALAGSGLKED